jgi:hypothetical protein
MGRPPIVTTTPAAPFTLNGLVEFWGVDGQMGMDLSIRSSSGDWRPRALNPRTLADHPLAYVIGDLTDQLAADAALLGGTG